VLKQYSTQLTISEILKKLEGVPLCIISDLISFLYTGKVTFTRENYDLFIKTAHDLDLSFIGQLYVKKISCDELSEFKELEEKHGLPKKFRIHESPMEMYNRFFRVMQFVEKLMTGCSKNSENSSVPSQPLDSKSNGSSQIVLPTSATEEASEEVNNTQTLLDNENESGDIAEKSIQSAEFESSAKAIPTKLNDNEISISESHENKQCSSLSYELDLGYGTTNALNEKASKEHSMNVETSDETQITRSDTPSDCEYNGTQKKKRRLSY